MAEIVDSAVTIALDYDLDPESSECCATERATNRICDRHHTKLAVEIRARDRRRHTAVGEVCHAGTLDVGEYLFECCECHRHRNVVLILDRRGRSLAAVCTMPSPDARPLGDLAQRIPA